MMDLNRVSRRLWLLALALAVLPLAGCRGRCCPCPDQQAKSDKPVDYTEPVWRLIRLKNRHNRPVTLAVAKPAPNSPEQHVVGPVPVGQTLASTGPQIHMAHDAYVQVTFDDTSVLTGSGSYPNAFIDRLDLIEVWNGGGLVTVHFVNRGPATFSLSPVP